MNARAALGTLDWLASPLQEQNCASRKTDGPPIAEEAPSAARDRFGRSNAPQASHMIWLRLSIPQQGKICVLTP